ncbi:catalase family protein [Aetokthonos hydrillicola Thurmond2011]|jgi:catalase|uniref:Catalase family protein n=1 Tax=Aetokthonos hydrillicola Thurmond2011 TaxID=2712845 RepID=A0AAP5I3U7_9CYAN|nr:catalase family protein [Aetokthonos hydrillicola]MBO3458570.1 catalase family protein [Aetokthonos hydrillicola CCALA 1050]MBW4585013.1 catalase family protein [Aetokthonos hydrillicola CCALA 1050]MDR9894226.1 catalase family protein [Aetokthonos hydrillicola Thurmond2011]
MSDLNPSVATEESQTDTILANVLEEQSQKGPDLRQTHPKSHGLVWGEFIVEDNIPESFRVGVFATKRSYPIWVRLSNASAPEKRGKLKSDLEPDIRGLAIKLLEVEGEKVLDDEKYTQDFIFLSHPVFITRTVQQFADLSKLGIGQANPELLQSLAPVFEIIQAAASKQIVNPLLVPYWSTTPYKLGSHVIKFSLKPHQQDEVSDKKPESENYLRESVVKYLTQEAKEANFDFLIQLFVDEEKTPIEDPTQEWKEEDAPTIKLATVKIPPQKFDFEERDRLNEGLSFSPWHTLPEHEPLGAINLARKKVYLESAKFRREHIEQRLREPQPYNQILDELDNS